MRFGPKVSIRPMTTAAVRLTPEAVEAALLASASMQQSPRMAEGAATDAVAGRVGWAPAKSLWIGGMSAAALLAPVVATPGALALFVVTTAVTVCLGHSLGMHRRLIHRSYDCPLWIERLFVYLGTLVGIAGPFGISGSPSATPTLPIDPLSSTTAGGSSIASSPRRTRRS